MVYRILKHVISERVETQTSLCGCSRYFWFTICSWDRRGREKKAAWFKVFSLYSWHLQVFSLQKKQVVVYGIWCCIFNKKLNFCLRFGEIPYILYFTKLPSNWVVHAWVESRSLCFECTEMIFCLFWTILGGFWTLQNCFNLASFRIEVASFLFGVMICCLFFAIFGGFWTLFRTVLIQWALSLKYLRSCNLNTGRFGV